MADRKLTRRLSEQRLKRTPSVKAIKGANRRRLRARLRCKTDDQGRSASTLPATARPMTLSGGASDTNRSRPSVHNLLLMKEGLQTGSDSAASPMESPTRMLRTVNILCNVVHTSMAAASAELTALAGRGEFAGPASPKILDKQVWQCAPVDGDTERSFLSSFSKEGKRACHKLNGSIKGARLSKTKYYKTHDFKIHTYKSPHWCALCHNFIWGLSNQGMKCQVCGMDIHKHCYDLAMKIQCKPSRKMIREVFGSDLTTVALLDGTYVPKIVQECIEAIEERGLKDKSLYHLSGLTAEMMNIREMYNKGEKVDLSLCTDVNIITGVLKMFLRELPAPVISLDAYSEIMKITASLSASDDSSIKYKQLSNALRLLPKANYLLLKYLAEHFHRVEEHSTDNAITARSLAAIMAPILMRAPSMDVSFFKDSHLQQYFVECLILKTSLLFS